MVILGKSNYFAIAVLLLSAPASACAQKEAAMDCHIEGVKYLGTDLNDAAVCQRFVTGLGDTRVRVSSVRIVVTQRGAINVQLSMMNGESQDFGMDVMDRPMRISDLDQLAQSVAGQL